MSTLSEVSQSGIGWVYPPQPRTEINVIDEVIGVVNGLTALVQDQDYIDVGFGTEQPSEDWVMLGEPSIINTLDSTPLNVWSGVVTNKTTTGFRLQLNGVPDTGNYFLSWSIRGVFGYYLTGPTSGPHSAPSNQFTVRLPDDTSLTGTVVITPSDGGVGGTFTPTSVSLTAAAPSATFTYSPSSYGARSIATTNNRGLVNPPQIGFTAVAGSYTMSGPSSGIVGVQSTDFTVALPVGGVVPAPVTITPADGSDGSFTPATVELTTAAPSATFKYTPASVGAKAISVTNDGGLTNPTNITYTASNPAFLDNFTGTSLLSSHTADTGQTWQFFVTGACFSTNVGSGSVYNNNSGEENFSSFTPAAADAEAEITIIKGALSGTAEVGIWLRATAHATNPRGYMGRYLEGSGFQFYRLDAGITYVQLGSNTAGSIADGDVLKFTISGTGATVTLTLYKNGTQVAQTTDVSGNRITTNGKVGISINDSSSGAGNYRINKLTSPV